MQRWNHSCGARDLQRRQGLSLVQDLDSRGVSRFFREFEMIFVGEAFIPIFGDLDAGILDFLLHMRIVVFDTENVYLTLQVKNFMIQEVTKKPKL